MKQISRITVVIALVLIISLSVVPTLFAETVGDQACYAVSYNDGTNPPTNELRRYVGDAIETVDYAMLEAFLGMPIPDQETLAIDSFFDVPAQPFRIANIVVPAPAVEIAIRDNRATANGALLQEYMHVYSSLELEPGVPLGDIDVYRWPLWATSQAFEYPVGNYWGYPNFVGESGPMAQMNIAFVPGMDPVFFGEYYQCDVTAMELVDGHMCNKVEYTLMGNDINPADPRIGTVVIEEWYPVYGDPTNPTLAPIQRIDMMNFIGVEVQTRLSDGPTPCVPEIATIALMSAGLVGVGGFVYFRKRHVSLPSA